jgi:class 3 adenylate cyclase/tetratricopeptide (TPR) repeat protein
MVTVLFADLVDSTGLAQRLDPERSREILGRFFDASVEELNALRGRPEKFIGDAVMAVFGLPHVHEDDALRAIRAGLAIRGRVRRLGREAGLETPLEIRVGIESGEAATGVGPARQLLVTGPVVNTAARLQSAAEAGEVLAGQTAHALTASTVTFKRRRRVKAKGFDDAIAAYPVVGLSMRSARRTIPIVGRTSEQAIIGQSLELATTSRRPVLVTVIGEAGIGKSRLADEFTVGLGATVLTLRGQSRSYTDSATFSPAAAIVSDLAGIASTDPPEKIRAALAALVRTVCASDDPGRVAERLGLLFGVAEEAKLEPAFVHDVQAGFLSLIDGLAAERPVVLVFEDVHMLKAPMLDLIERLGSPPRGGRRVALILALARAELLDERPAWGSSSANAVLVRLDPLADEDAVDLVRHASGGAVGDRQAAEIAARAGGNPFFIIETTGMLMPEPGGNGEARSDPRSLPPTVQAVVAARLDALPGRLRELARRAAVFMSSFDTDELASVDAEATEAELRELEESEVVVREETGAGKPRWRMRHSMLRDVAYASLPKRERVRLHERVAEYLTSAGHRAWAADHLEAAAISSLDLDPTDRSVAEKAADALLAAGDRARRRMEGRTATDRYSRALALAGPEEGWGVREARALAGIGEALYWLGEYEPATDALLRSVALGEAHGDDFTLALALRFLGDMAINHEADVDKAKELLDRSLEAAERLQEPWAITRTLLFAGWVPWTRQRWDEAEALWQRALAAAEPSDRWARVRALTSLSINHGEMKDYAGALKLIEEARAYAEEAGDQFSIATTSVQTARALHDFGRPAEALPWFDRGIAIFAELGARWEHADARAARGIAKTELGMLDEAEEDLRYAIKVAEELGDRQLPSWTWRALARVAEKRGDTAEAEERMRRSREARARGPR